VDTNDSLDWSHFVFISRVIWIHLWSQSGVGC
jgi:hypothetical protein